MESNICTLIECKSIAMQTFLDLYKLEIQKIECRDIKIEYNVKLIKSKKISIEIIIRPSYINGLFYGKRFITTLLRVNKISDKKYKIIKIYKKDYVFYRFLKKITKGDDIVKTCRENIFNFFLRFVFAYRYGGEEPATYRGKNIQYLYVIILVLIAIIFAYLIARDRENSYYWSIFIN